MPVAEAFCGTSRPAESAPEGRASGSNVDKFHDDNLSL